MWVFFVGDNDKKNIEMILIFTLVSGSVLTLVIVITIYLFWKSKQKQRYLLLQIHESNKICPCKINFHPY
jgi:preprotein translocase subunit SecF